MIRTADTINGQMREVYDIDNYNKLKLCIWQAQIYFHISLLQITWIFYSMSEC